MYDRNPGEIDFGLRLTKCWRPNIVFETTKEITFTAACKMAMEQ